jgi:hypothetical protein
MKTLLLSLSLAIGAMSTAHAEIYRPSIVGNTAVIGAVAGALIGGHNNDHWAEGALIGGAAGALVGVAIDQSQPRVYRQSQSCEIAPVVQVPCAPVYSSAPRVVYVPARPRVVYVHPVVVSRPVVYVSNGHRDYRGHGHGHGHGRRHDGWR